MKLSEVKKKMQPLFYIAFELQHNKFPGKRCEPASITLKAIRRILVFRILVVIISILPSQLTQQGKSRKERQLEGRVSTCL